MRQEPCRSWILPKLEPVHDKMGARYLHERPQQMYTRIHTIFHEEFGRAKREQDYVLVPLPIGVPLLRYDGLRLVS